MEEKISNLSESSPCGRCVTACADIRWEGPVVSLIIHKTMPLCIALCGLFCTCWDLYRGCVLLQHSYHFKNVLQLIILITVTTMRILTRLVSNWPSWVWTTLFLTLTAEYFIAHTYFPLCFPLWVLWSAFFHITVLVGSLPLNSTKSSSRFTPSWLRLLSVSY